LALAQSESDEYKQANHELMLIYGGEFQVVASPEVKKAFGEFLFAVSLNPFSEGGKGATKSGKLVLIVPDLHRSLTALALLTMRHLLKASTGSNHSAMLA
jgi:hypothetical protein